MPGISRFPDIVRVGAELVGAGVTGGVLIGSLILGGNLIFNTEEIAAPSLVHGSGAFLTYTSCVTGSGKTTATQNPLCTVTTSGATAGANTCTIMNPYDGVRHRHQGSGAIVRFQYDVIANPAAVKHDIDVVRVKTISGSRIANDFLVGSGQTFSWTGSGTSPSGPVIDRFVMNSGGFLKVTATSNPTAAYRAVCKAWFTQVDADAY